jgi:hypothetical protein
MRLAALGKLWITGLRAWSLGVGAARVVAGTARAQPTMKFAAPPAGDRRTTAAYTGAAAEAGTANVVELRLRHWMLTYSWLQVRGAKGRWRRGAAEAQALFFWSNQYNRKNSVRSVRKLPARPEKSFCTNDLFYGRCTLV